MSDSISPATAVSDSAADMPDSLREAQIPIQVVMRFQTSVRSLENALTRLAESSGFLRGSIARSVDDPRMCVLTMEFADVGAYRKALSRYDIKAEVVPLLSTTIDDITTYEVAVMNTDSERTTYSSGHAHDSAHTSLGTAAQPQVEPLSHDFS